MIATLLLVGIFLFIGYIWGITYLVCNLLERYIWQVWWAPVALSLSFIGVFLPLCIGWDLYNYFK